MRVSRFPSRLLAACCLAFGSAAVAVAQNVTYEAVTFDDTARGFNVVTITPPGRPQLATCEGKLEEGQIRIRYDGTAPTDTEGTLVDVGNTIRLESHQTLESFRGIRTGGSSGIIRFHCTQEPVLELTGTGGGSSGGGGGGDGTIIDGANGAIAATVKDFTNSNPLTVLLVDTNGDAQAISGGTQYTEDAASAANPIGTMNIARRRDTLTASEVSADNDNIALNATSKGELYVKQTDAVPVTDNGGSLTVDNGGTFAVQAAQTGTWTVQPGNTANTTAWLVTGTGGTFPATQSGTWNLTNISGTISLPTGAASAANQSTELTALQLIDNLPNTLGSTTSGQSGALGLGAVTSTAPTYTDAQTNALSLQENGSLRVAVTNYPTAATTAAISVRCVNAIGTTFESCAGSGGGGGTGLTDTELRATPVPVLTTNAGTFATQAAQSGTWNITNVSGTVSLPTGAATAANQATANTSLQLIDNIVQTEDTAAADGDSGVVLLARRAIGPANTSSNDGDYESLQISAGRVWTSTVIDSPLPGGSNNIGSVTVASSALPSGAATAAKQPALGTAGSAATDVLTVQGIASMTPLLATLSGTNNIATVTTVSAVTAITSALPAGTNAIGKLTANSGVIIGDVNVVSASLPTGAATAANQASELAYIDGLETLIGTSNTSLALIDNLPNTLGSTTSGQSGALALGAVTTAAPTYTTAQSNALSLQTDGSLRVAVNAAAASSANQATEITSLQLIDDAVYTEDVASAEDTKGFGVMFRRHDANTSLVGTDGDWGFGQLDATGSIKVAIISGGGTGGTSAIDDADFTDSSSTGNPVMAVAESAAPSTVTEGDLGMLAMTLNRALKVTLYNSSGAELTTSSDVTEDVAETSGVTGPAVMTVRRDTAASSAGTSGDYATFNTNSAGRLYTASVTEATAVTTNAAVPYYLTSAASNNATSVKASAGNIYAYQLINTTATLYFLRLYNLATSPTCSSATGFVKTIPIPANTSGGGLVSSIDVGEGFSTGIAFCLTSGGSSTDNGSAATGVYINIAYK